MGAWHIGWSHYPSSTDYERTVDHHDVYLLNKVMHVELCCELVAGLKNKLLHLMHYVVERHKSCQLGYFVFPYYLHTNSGHGLK